MKKQNCSSLNREDITIAPKEVRFSEHGILFLKDDGGFDQLDEDRILLVCLEKEDPSASRLRVEEISAETTGTLLLETIYGTRCEIQTQKMGKTAGEVLILIVQQYPWLWVGDHACLDSGNPKDLKQLQEMVEEMRACSILFG